MKIQRTRYAIVTKDRQKILKNAGRYKEFCDISGDKSKSVFMTYKSRKIAESYIKNHSYKVSGDTEVVEVQEILADNMGSISDGYHTFDELYEHRITLYIALLSVLADKNSHWSADIWISKFHSDGTSFDGWFILGINKEIGEQITYHIPMKYWEQISFAETLEKAPEFDSHSSKDVLERLQKLFFQKN